MVIFGPKKTKKDIFHCLLHNFRYTRRMFLIFYRWVELFLNYTLHTLNMFIRLTENFLDPSQVTLSVTKRAYFYSFFGIFWYFDVQKCEQVILKFFYSILSVLRVVWFWFFHRWVELCLNYILDCLSMLIRPTDKFLDSSKVTLHARKKLIFTIFY